LEFLPAGEALRSKATKDQGSYRINSELASGFMPGKALSAGASIQ